MRLDEKSEKESSERTVIAPGSGESSGHVVQTRHAQRTAKTRRGRKWTRRRRRDWGRLEQKSGRAKEYTNKVQRRTTNSRMLGEKAMVKEAGGASMTAAAAFAAVAAADPGAIVDAALLELVEAEAALPAAGALPIGAAGSSGRPMGPGLL